MKDTFEFSAVTRFTITPEQAAQILSDPKPDFAAQDWITKQHPNAEEYPGSHAPDQIRKALGSYLAEQRIEQAKQLTLPADTVEAKP